MTSVGRRFAPALEIPHQRLVRQGTASGLQHERMPSFGGIVKGAPATPL